jgi:hypothetical protein
MFLDLRTKEKEIVGRLYNTLELYGFRGIILPIDKIKALHNSSWRNYLSGKIPPRVNRYLEFVFPVKPSKIFNGASSVLLVSAAAGYNEIRFDWVRKSRRMVLPPGFEAYRKTEKEIKKIMTDAFSGYGYNFVRAVWPLKLISSYCSFLRYGTNTVAYVPFKKSTSELFAFYTDLPFERGTSDIFTILRELCDIRPKNKQIQSRENTFTVNETRLLLESTPLNKIPETTRRKIISTDLIFIYDKLPKQLWYLLKVKPADFRKLGNYI